jgi:serine/threonine protein kinase
MGALYLACTGDRGFERRCVIKTVLPHLADKDYIARFRDEAKVVVRLSHGNLVPVFDAGSVNDELFLAMEYIEGKDLRAVWNRCAKKGIAFPIDVAVHIARELARGLHYAHTFGGIKLVHRDVSPPNVLISFTGEVKLTDFGLASSTLKVERTAAGIVYGKISYMSPEQADAQPIDGRTDIYAAGIILWELLTGRQLFPQQSADGTDLLNRVRNPSIDPPSMRAPRVPTALDQIVLKTLATDLGVRYATGEQLRADLTAFLATTKDFVATDATRVASFMHDLFEDDIARERAHHQQLIDHAADNLLRIKAQKQADRETAERDQQIRDDLRAGKQRPSLDRMPAVDGTRDAGAETAGVVDTDDPAQMIGTSIDRWKILRKLGEGGIGTVYEVEHREIGRRAAMKILRKVYSANAEVVGRFKMEAKSASQIKHPHIIQVTDSDTTVQGTFYMVMELLEGRDVADWLKSDRRLPMEAAFDIGQQVADALEAAHKNNIIHRDLKPENIFLITQDGKPNFVKVLDFGVAKSLLEISPRLTTPGMAMGTPAYMAPEQGTGGDSDGRSDVYSLGAILYEMLSGAQPITGENAVQVLTKKAMQDPDHIALKRKDVPERAAHLIMRMLARTPDARPRTMGEVASELRLCLDELRAGTAIPASLPPAGHPLSKPPQPEVRARWLVAVLGLLGVVLGLLVGLYFVLKPPPPKPLGQDLGVDGGPRTLPPDLRAPLLPPKDAGVGDGGAKPDASTEKGPGPKKNPDKTNPKPSGKAKLGTLDMPTEIDVSTARAKVEDGRLKLGSGKSGAAFQSCYEAAGNSQMRGGALACMGEARFADGKFSDAIKWGVEGMKQKSPPAKDLKLLLAKAYYKKNDCAKAKKYWKEVLAGSDANNKEAQEGLTKCGN